MDQYLCQLPPEVREHILQYCSKEDVLNLACSSKSYYHSMRYLLWERLCITWWGVKKEISPEALQQMKWTSSLSFIYKRNNNEENTEAFIPLHISDEDEPNFSDDDENLNDDDEDDDDDGEEDEGSGSDSGQGVESGIDEDEVESPTSSPYHIELNKSKPMCETIEWSLIEPNFRKLLTACNPRKLIKLHLSAFFDCNGLNHAVDILPNLQQLSLSNIVLGSSGCWAYLTKLKQLKMLYLCNCEISDNHIGEIIASTKVEDLALNQCPDVKDKSLMHISQAKRVKRVTLSHNPYILPESYECLERLTNLEKLKLEYTNLSDTAFVRICKNCTKLRSLNVCGSISLTDLGLCAISNLPLLKVLNISMCTSLTNDGFWYIRELPLQKLFFSWSHEINDSVFLLLKNITSLKELNILNINNRFSIVAIDNFCIKAGMKKKTVFNSWIFSFFTLVKDYFMDIK